MGAGHPLPFFTVMNKAFVFSDYFDSVLAKDETAIVSYFAPDAQIVWHNTGEVFTPAVFARVNAVYPGSWKGEIEYELDISGEGSELVVAACRVFSPDGISCHSVSFIRIRRGLIERLDEYWGDDGEPPEWRRAQAPTSGPRET